MKLLLAATTSHSEAATLRKMAAAHCKKCQLRKCAGAKGLVPRPSSWPTNQDPRLRSSREVWEVFLSFSNRFLALRLRQRFWPAVPEHGRSAASFPSARREGDTRLCCERGADTTSRKCRLWRSPVFLEHRRHGNKARSSSRSSYPGVDLPRPLHQERLAWRSVVL